MATCGKRFNYLQLVIMLIGVLLRKTHFITPNLEISLFFTVGVKQIFTDLTSYLHSNYYIIISLQLL